jgi:hypothetical protein
LKSPLKQILPGWPTVCTPHPAPGKAGRQTNTFKPGDFTLRSDGVCRLNPELARRVLRVVMEALR